MTARRQQVDYSRLEGTITDPALAQRITAAVIGVGALGNEVARLLGLIGVSHVISIDPDRVEASNLTRSVFFRADGAVGRPKAQVLVEEAARLFPDTRWTALECEVADAGSPVFRDVNLIFSCVDSDAARVEIAWLGHKAGVPVIDGGLAAGGHSTGRVTVFPSREHACFSCMLPAPVRARILAEGEFSANSCQQDPESKLRSSSPVVASMVAAWQLDQGFRFLVRPYDFPSTVSLHIAMEDAQVIAAAVPRDPLCPLHCLTHEMAFYDDRLTCFRDLFPRYSQASRILLDWPVCAAARCRRCRHSWKPFQRLGWMRRTGRCPNCGAAGFRFSEVVRDITAASEFADRAPRELGLPVSDWLQVSDV